MGIRPISAENHRSVPTSTYKGFDQCPHKFQDYRLLLTFVSICAQFIKSMTKSKRATARISELQKGQKTPKCRSKMVRFVDYLPCSRLVPAGGSREPQGCGSHQAANDYKACSPGRENDLPRDPRIEFNYPDFHKKKSREKCSN